jgi:diguanylate cyclase (GGDEF)-like protein
MDRLRQALAALERQPGRIALLFLDIDGFKAVNDTWGHRAGDHVLCEIATRLTGVSRRFDTVARYGGDEFVLLLTGVRANENLRAIGARVMRAVETRIGEVGDGVQLSASIGAVVCEDPGADPLAVLEAGDTAMYAAKREGGGRLTIFDAGLHRPVRRSDTPPRLG